MKRGSSKVLRLRMRLSLMRVTIYSFILSLNIYLKMSQVLYTILPFALSGIAAHVEHQTSTYHQKRIWQRLANSQKTRDQDHLLCNQLVTKLTVGPATVPL
ncbi:hypothetical protein E2C01_054905 [Portunus trituberculatus]|uniref:Uncharacterized protein n=1 Tax=Portunus trituberculatus TaxID=210409 RepID=A0A5B7GTF9_PORTR|nr:hypothetical protein [Portunus trituberculatus]